MSHTFALLELSQTAYAEIEGKLRDAGYDHAINVDGSIDMHGIGVTRDATAETSGYVLPAACVRILIDVAERAGVEHVTFGVMDPKAGLHPDLPGYIGVIREDVSKLRAVLK